MSFARVAGRCRTRPAARAWKPLIEGGLLSAGRPFAAQVTGRADRRVAVAFANLAHGVVEPLLALVRLVPQAELAGIAQPGDAHADESHRQAIPRFVEQLQNR